VDAVREHPLFDGIADGTCFYFVHSFAPAPADERVVLAVTSTVVRSSVPSPRLVVRGPIPPGEVL